ncbi:hypothetical protein ACGFYU_00565 [Streptomyces sp. NPDC048337]|uniref:hypothetical protein n=1 Tax=Streptomyces sp. NPDC048337 TaxID=3365535 RepID=UPI003723D128
MSVVRARIGARNLPAPLPTDPSRSEAYADWARTHEPGAESAALGLLAEARDRVSPVAEVGEALGVGPDAGGLYLQLLAPARPTDRNVRRWNRWTPARHKAAQAGLSAAGAVETGRRARAGRTAFVPGPWTEL